MHKNEYAGDTTTHLRVHLNHYFWNVDLAQVKLKDSLYSKCTKNSSCSLQTEKQEYCTEPIKKKKIKHNTSNKILDKTQETKIQRTAALETKLK